MGVGRTVILWKVIESTQSVSIGNYSYNNSGAMPSTKRTKVNQQAGFGHPQTTFYPKQGWILDRQRNFVPQNKKKWKECNSKVGVHYRTAHYVERVVYFYGQGAIQIQRYTRIVIVSKVLTFPILLHYIVAGWWLCNNNSNNNQMWVPSILLADKR